MGNSLCLSQRVSQDAPQLRSSLPARASLLEGGGQLGTVRILAARRSSGRYNGWGGPGANRRVVPGSEALLSRKKVFDKRIQPPGAPDYFFG